MAVKDLDTKANEKFDPYTDAGRDLYKPKSVDDYDQQDYDDRFADMARNLENDEFNAIAKNETDREFGNITDRLKAAEESPKDIPKTDRPTAKPERQKNTARPKGRMGHGLRSLRRRSSLLAIIVAITGGGGFLTIFFSPSLAIVQMKEVFTSSLNDQLHAVDSRSNSLFKAKLQTPTKGSCGVVKIACRFASMSDAEVAKFEANNSGIKIERDMTKGFGSKRGQITKISYIDDNGVTVIDNADQLAKELKNNIPFRTVWQKGYNPKFATLSDSVAVRILERYKASKSPKATGENDEQRKKNVNDAVGGTAESGAKPVVASTDEDGKTTYTADGQPVPEGAIDGAQQTGADIEKLTSGGGTSGLFKSAIKGLQITALASNACMVYTAADYASGLSQTVKKAQAIRFAMAMILTPADAIKAGDATEGDTNYVGNNLTMTRPSGTVLDETKLNDPNSSSQPATTDDPEAGMNAFDSPGYKIAAYGDAPDLSLRASRFMLAGGSALLLNKVLSSIATVVNGGDPNPKGVRQKCRVINSPAVQVGSLAVGIIAGIGSFGLTTAAGIAGSVALSLSLPYIESQIGDMLAGNVFKDLTGIDSGDAGYVGTAGLLGDVAMARGEKPLNASEGVQQLSLNRQTEQQYAQTEQYAARSTPFDLSNRYSFLGSMVYTLMPMVQTSKSSASAAMMNVASMIPTTIGGLVKPAGALSTDYFDKCNDINYKSIGIAGGPFCEVRYGMSEEDLAVDPIENATWMATTGNIDGSSEDGTATDNGQSWNYVKYLAECVNRTTGWGIGNDQGEADGSNCTDPSKAQVNQHFRVYTMDKSVDGSMADTAAAADDQSDTPDTTDAISAAGWVYPTDGSLNVTKAFGVGSYPGSQGVDIAGTSADTASGKPAYAAFKGTVIASGNSDQYKSGWVVLQHQVNNQLITTVYARLDPGSIKVHNGDNVDAGAVIGSIAKSSKDGDSHLHFELWEGSALGGGQAVDPVSILGGAKRAGGTIDV